MKIKEFEDELQKDVHSALTIKSSPVVGLASVCFKGQSLFAVPDNDIFDDPTPMYSITLPNGTEVVHRGRKDALSMARIMVKRFEDPDNLDALLGVGKYSDEALKE